MNYLPNLRPYLLGPSYRVISCACYKDKKLKDRSEWCEFCLCRWCGEKDMPKVRDLTHSLIPVHTLSFLPTFSFIRTNSPTQSFPLPQLPPSLPPNSLPPNSLPPHPPPRPVPPPRLHAGVPAGSAEAQGLGQQRRRTHQRLLARPHVARCVNVCVCVLVRVCVCLCVLERENVHLCMHACI